MGVGSESLPSYMSRDLFSDFGSAGGEENSSKAGRREAVGFFVATPTGAASFRGGGKSISLSCSRGLSRRSSSLLVPVCCVDDEYQRRRRLSWLPSLAMLQFSSKRPRDYLVNHIYRGDRSRNGHRSSMEERRAQGRARSVSDGVEPANTNTRQNFFVRHSSHSHFFEVQCVRSKMYGAVTERMAGEIVHSVHEQAEEAALRTWQKYHDARVIPPRGSPIFSATLHCNAIRLIPRSQTLLCLRDA